VYGGAVQADRVQTSYISLNHNTEPSRRTMRFIRQTLMSNHLPYTFNRHTFIFTLKS
jgi:hypothetical protein